MHIGVTVPLTEFGADLVGLRDFVQAVEELGYAHVRLLDHVLGADPIPRCLSYRILTRAISTNP